MRKITLIKTLQHTFKKRSNAIIFLIGIVIIPVFIFVLIFLNIYSLRRQSDLINSHFFISGLNVNVPHGFMSDTPNIDILNYHTNLAFYIEGFSEENRQLYYNLITNEVAEMLAGIGNHQEGASFYYLMEYNSAFFGYTRLGFEPYADRFNNQFVQYTVGIVGLLLAVIIIVVSIYILKKRIKMQLIYN